MTMGRRWLKQISRPTLGEALMVRIPYSVHSYAIRNTEYEKNLRPAYLHTCNPSWRPGRLGVRFSFVSAGRRSWRLL